MGINDYGGTGDALNSPPLGGPGGWAEAVAAVVDGDDTTVDARIAAAVAGIDAGQYLLPAEVLAGENVTVDTATTPGSVIVSASGGSSGDFWGRWFGTQSEYDALGTYDPDTLYVIEEDLTLTQADTDVSAYAEGTSSQVTLDVQAGDLIVISGLSSVDEADPSASNDGAALTWTDQAEFNQAIWSATQRVLTAVADTTRTIVVTVNFAKSAWCFATGQVWRNHGGVGAVISDVSTSGSSPVFSFTTTTAGSVIVVAWGDRNAQDITGRSYLANFGAATEIDAQRTASAAGLYQWNHESTPAPTTADIGITGVATQAVGACAIEILPVA